MFLFFLKKVWDPNLFNLFFFLSYLFVPEQKPCSEDIHSIYTKSHLLLRCKYEMAYLYLEGNCLVSCLAAW